MKRQTLFYGILLGVFASTAAAQTPLAAQSLLPHFEKRGNVTQLIVDGQPFTILGGQVANSTGFPERMELAAPKFTALNANTIEFPIFWEQVEPQEGKFDFAGVDRIIRLLREKGLRAIPLWFGTYKNGTMDYVPDWIKADTRRFPRVLDYGGRPIRVLSPHGSATLEADRRAYGELMKHLKAIDGNEHTVILVQVENESGLLGSVRDYSPEATRLFNGPVPDALVRALNKKPGTWKEVFGARAEEMFTGFHVATYINAVARAGKDVYPIPAFVNVWMGGYGTNDRFLEFDRPGDSYPSGGPQSHMIDLWKAAAPDIDLIGPDIYHQSSEIYRTILSRYRRPDNPLFVVETGGGKPFARYFFYALVDYGAIGFTCYGFDSNPGVWLNAQFVEIAANFRVVKSALPVIAELQAAGKLQAAVEEPAIPGRMVYFERYDILVRFHPPTRGSAPATGATVMDQSAPSGRVLVGELGPDEFLIAGFDVALDFKPPMGSELTNAQFLLVEEGTYDKGEWKTTRLRNGDINTSGLRFPADGALIKVKLMRY